MSALSPPFTVPEQSMQEGFIARLARGIGYAVGGGEAARWFGPQAPLPPAAPADVAGRQFDYPFGFNLAVTPRSHEPTGFAELRGLADSYDLLRCVIETRKDQVERLTWHIRKRAGLAAQASDAARIAALAAFFARPDKLHAWPSWLRMLLEDLLVIDAPTLYLRRTRGGAIWSLDVLDGATIKRLIDPWGRTPEPPAPAYQQILKGLPAVDYTADELIYAPRNCRAHKAYGFSPVEQVQMSVNIALRRQIYQLQYYTEGNIPEALIGVPDSWNPDQIRQFQSYWDALNAGDTAERRHAKFVPGGVAKTFIPTREPAMKDVFDEWLARIICFAFSIPPSALVAQVNRATAETAQDTALSEGLAPLQLWVKQLVDQVIASEFQAPDLEFAWDEDRAVDPSDVARIAASYVAAGIKSVNEVRAELGLAPVPGGDLPAGPNAPGSNEASPPVQGSDKLLRFNSNHYGPGERGGQFAPADSGGPSDDNQSNHEQRDAIDSFAAFLATSKYSPQAKALLSRLYSLLKDGNLDTALQDPNFDVARLKQLLENGVKDLPAEASSALDLPKPLSALMTKKPPMGFDTPQQLSAYLGDPPPGYQWHHIVGQAQTRPELTTPMASRTIINHTNNMVLIPTIRHYLITGIMNMGNESGRRVGDGVRDLPAYEQRQIGLHFLRVTGVLQ